MKLIDLLILMETEKDKLPLTAEESKSKKGGILINCRNCSDISITLCFMADPDSWIEAYPESAILVPWYDCEVTDITPEKNTLNIWLAYEKFLVEKGLVVLNDRQQ